MNIFYKTYLKVDEKAYSTQGRMQLFKEVSQNFSKVGTSKLASINVSNQEKSMWIKYPI